MNFFATIDADGDISVQATDLTQEEMRKSLEQEGSGEKMVRFLAQDSPLVQALATLVGVNSEQPESLLKQLEAMLTEVYCAGWHDGHGAGWEGGFESHFDHG